METVAEIRSNITKELKNAEVAVRYTERLAANVPLISQQNLVLPPQYSTRFSLSIELESVGVSLTVTARCTTSRAQVLP
jgi:hypothetical protein